MLEVFYGFLDFREATGETEGLQGFEEVGVVEGLFPVSFTDFVRFRRQKFDEPCLDLTFSECADSLRDLACIVFDRRRQSLFDQLLDSRLRKGNVLFHHISARGQRAFSSRSRSPAARIAC